MTSGSRLRLLSFRRSENMFSHFSLSLSIRIHTCIRSGVRFYAGDRAIKSVWIWILLKFCKTCTHRAYTTRQWMLFESTLNNFIWIIWEKICTGIPSGHCFPPLKFPLLLRREPLLRSPLCIHIFLAALSDGQGQTWRPFSCVYSAPVRFHQVKGELTGGVNAELLRTAHKLGADLAQTWRFLSGSMTWRMLGNANNFCHRSQTPRSHWFCTMCVWLRHRLIIILQY